MMTAVSRTITKFSLSLILLIGFSATAQDKLTEDWLIENIKSNGVDALAAEELKISADEVELNSRRNYDFTLGGRGQIYRSNADSSNSFQPAVRNSHAWDVNASKAWSFGATTVFGIKNDYSKLSSTSGDILSHSPNYYLQIQLSLLQNFLGKADRGVLSQGEIAKESLNLQSKMAMNGAINKARSIYWSLVANRIAIDYSKALTQTSKQQLGEIRRRFKSGAAERSDIYLSEAQVSQRESALLALQIKEQGLLGELRLIAPEIPNIGVDTLPPLNIDNVIKTVSECIVEISAHRKSPYKNSSYKKLFSLYKNRLEAEKATASLGVGPELSLAGEIASKGVDNNFSDAFSETNKFSKGGWGSSLTFQVPLGSNSSKLIRNKIKMAELKELKARRELELLLNGTHQSALKSIQYLMNSMRTLDSSTESLNKRVEAVQKKYRQGRVDFLSLVQEQDQLFNSKIGLTESQLLFLTELFNYFSVYDKTNCEFNTKHAALEN